MMSKSDKKFGESDKLDKALKGTGLSALFTALAGVAVVAGGAIAAPVIVPVAGAVAVGAGVVALASGVSHWVKNGFYS
jgi:hypothetical protein